MQFHDQGILVPGGGWETFHHFFIGFKRCDPQNVVIMLDDRRILMVGLFVPRHFDVAAHALIVHHEIVVDYTPFKEQVVFSQLDVDDFIVYFEFCTQVLSQDNESERHIPRPTCSAAISRSP